MSEYVGWVSLEIDRLQREDRMREARLNRLERMGGVIEPKTASLSSRLLYRIGEVMSAWGARLKERNGCEDELSFSPAGNCRMLF